MIGWFGRPNKTFQIRFWKTVRQARFGHSQRSRLREMEGSTLDLGTYLERIGITGRDLRPTVETLRQLHRQHLLNVPFENLDIHWRRPIILDTDRFFRKIVGERRGGFCYELNGLFERLLAGVGFKTRLVSARVFSGDAGFGPEFDHLAILVTIGDREYLADVGFGAFTSEPLEMTPDLEQSDATGIFKIVGGDGSIDVCKLENGDWTPEYRFSTDGRELEEFNAMCEFHQTSPDSHFTRRRICSMMTEIGRKTISGDRLITTVDGNRTEVVIETDAELEILLDREFGIVKFEGDIESV